MCQPIRIKNSTTLCYKLSVRSITCVHAAIHLMVTGLSILTDVTWRGRLCNTHITNDTHPQHSNPADG